LESKPFRLKAGIKWQDKTGESVEIRDGVVRLITRKERRNIDHGAASHRDDAFLRQSIVRLGPLTNADLQVDGWKILEALADVTVEQIGAEIKKLASGGDADDLIESALSEPFELIPGVIIDGVRITTCAVRLLTRGDNRAIAAAGSVQEADDIQTARTIAAFGDIADRDKIAQASESLTGPDLLRIMKEHKGLLDRNAPADPDLGRPVEYDIEGVELLSAPFELAHGVKYEGRLLKVCVVRLVSRGETRAAGLLPEADYHEAIFTGSIAQLGDVVFDRSRSMPKERYELLARLAAKLTPGDGGRIGAEVDALRASFPGEGADSSPDNNEHGKGALGDPVSDQAESAE
jgi:hypothetical protein